ncbi:MAG: hypothetical protein ACYC1M_13500 [Armatimonadota bacterium]
MAAADRLLIFDACVLIDICLEDPSLLGLAASSLGKIVILSPILQEVNQLDDMSIERFALSVVDPEIQVVIEATTRRGGLSFRDRICLIYARECKGTLYTNDRALLKAAISDGIDARWGLEILIELVEVDQLTSADALAAAQSICDRSRFPSDPLIAEFRRRLDKLT